MTTKAKKSLFDTLYDGCDEAIKAMRKPLARKSLKRKFRSGYDDAQGKIDDAEIAIEDEVKKITKCDLSVCLEKKDEIRQLKEMQQDLSDLYAEIFSEDFNPDIE